MSKRLLGIKNKEGNAATDIYLFVFLFGSRLRPLGLNILGYQKVLL